MTAANAPETLRASAPPDAEIIRRVVAGDTACFELLMRRHNQRVYRAIRAILHRDEADVEDAMQQTYLQAYDALAGFEGASSFATWITRIALNVALGRVRQRTRLAAAEALAGSDDERAEGPEDDASRRESMELLERAIDRLPESYRVVFMLREVEQLSTADAAHALGTSEENVKVRLHRARLALRDLVATEVGVTAPKAFAFLAPRCDRVVASVLGVLGQKPRPTGGEPQRHP
jgi:RNA polymerase sigma-70 factor, ECF subfamily